MYKIVDFVSKEKVVAKNFVFTGEKFPWEIVMDLAQVKSKINAEYFKKSPPYASKYLPFMPIRDYSKFVSLEEGATPLIPARVLGNRLGVDLWFKLETSNPTGSFKDRGSAVDISIAKELGAKGISVASTGNMAASCSCYAAAAHIPCYVFVPEGTPLSKLAQVIAFGGRVIQVKGQYNDAAQLAQKVAEELDFYLAGDYAYRVEGHKTAAYEIIDQFLFNVPDTVVVPIGCGTNIASYAKGFSEYQEFGFIDKVPRLVGAQAEGAKTVVASVEQKLKTVVTVKGVNTVATAIAIANPLDGLKALDAIYRSNGSAGSATDEEILESQYELSKEEGLFVEPSSACTLAVLKKQISPMELMGKKVVCVLTGAGLKDPTSLLRISLRPPTITPEINEFLDLYKKKFFNGKAVVFSNRDALIFTKEPELEEVKKKVEEYFAITYSDALYQHVQKVIGKFLKKGKPITFSDFQDILQEATEVIAKKTTKIFNVLDFKISAQQNLQSDAWVKVSLKGKEYEARAKGVGPVDAVINALKETGEKSFECTLLSYKVSVRSEGTDANVHVEVKLKRNQLSSVGSATSPDIIQASIEAYQEAYNSFL